jgi:hypothetical protein
VVVGEVTFLDELADELTILFAADTITYAQYVESILTMEAAAIEAQVRITVDTWAFLRLLRQAVDERVVQEGD